MSEPASSRHADLHHCRELAMRHGSPFEFSSRFVPKHQFEALLALYALLQAVGSVPRSDSDDTVKWAKLKWWAGELAADPAAVSRHPVVRALYSSGASAHLDAALLQRLVNDAAFQVDPAPVNDTVEMFERYAALGSTWIVLEAALHDASLDAQALRHLGAASYLFDRVNELAGVVCRGGTPNHQALNLDLPMDLLAKYKVMRDVPLCRQRNEAARLVFHLLVLARDWYLQGWSALQVTGSASACLHLQLRLALDQRWLTTSSQKRGVDGIKKRRFGPADAWFAWRFCRRLARA